MKASICGIGFCWGVIAIVIDVFWAIYVNPWAWLWLALAIVAFLGVCLLVSATRRGERDKVIDLAYERARRQVQS